VYLSDLLAALRRRWYAVIVGLLITAGLCVGAAKVAPAEYVAQSSIVLLPPATTVGTGGNPYLSLSGLQGAADVLARAMSGEAVSDVVAPAGGTATYTFEPDATTNGPMLVIEARDSSADGALSTLEQLLIIAPQELEKFQTAVGAPAESLIRVSTVTRDTTAETDRKSQTRAVIVAGVLGLALTVFGTSMLDGLLRRRKKSNRIEVLGAPPARERHRSVRTKESTDQQIAGPPLVQPRARNPRLRAPQGADRGSSVDSS
jgi:hypothetical protein